MAAGVLRLHARAGLSCDNFGLEKSHNSAPPGVELSDETVGNAHGCSAAVSTESPAPSHQVIRFLGVPVIDP